MFNGKRVFASIIVTMLLTVSIVACTPQQKPIPNQTTPNQGQTEMLPNQLPGIGGQNLSTPTTDGVFSNIQRAQRITQQLSSIGNISRAPVLIDGTTAIVGIEFVNKANSVIMDRLMNFGNNMRPKNMIPQTNPGINNSSQIGAPGTMNKVNISQTAGDQLINSGMDVKTAITQIVRSLDAGIGRVIFTTDKNIIDRIQRLSNGMADEINDITNKIQSGAPQR